MQTITGGEAVIESLIANGIDTVFGLPGAQLDEIRHATRSGQPLGFAPEKRAAPEALQQYPAHAPVAIAAGRA